MDLAVMHADGSNVRTLATFYGEGATGAVRWTGNGIEFHPGSFAYAVVNGIEYVEGLYTMDPDGTNVRPTGSEYPDALCPSY